MPEPGRAVIRLPAIPGLSLSDDNGGRRRLLPVALVALVVVAGVLLHHGELSPPTQLNDSGMHESVTRWAADRVRDAHNPFDGWYPYLGLGFPQTHQYQSLPHVLTGVAGLAVGVGAAYDWSLFLLLVLFPEAVWGGARLLGLGRWPAAGAAAVAPLLTSITGYGYEAGSYTWQGYGIWPQLWAACLMPIALGLAVRALRGEGSPAWATVAVAATIACHFLTGWLLLAIVCLMPLLQPRQLLRGALRMGTVVLGAGLLTAWVTLPLVLDADGADYSGYEPGAFYDSHGARRILGWLLSGELLDRGRLPVVTVLAAVGLVATMRRARTDVGARVVLLVAGSSLVLLFGRPTLGPVADLLPYGDGLFFPRFIIGVHLGGILLAGAGLAWLGRLLFDLLADLTPVAVATTVVAVAGAIVLAPAINERVDDASTGRSLMDAQRAAEERDGDDLRVLTARLRGTGGRVFAGSSADWGASYAVGFVPVYAYLLAEDVDAIGFQQRVSSVGTIVEPLFDGLDRRQYDLFGVRWLLAPEGRPPPIDATFVAQSGRHVLWSVDGAGYGQVIETNGVVTATPSSIRSVTAALLGSSSSSSSERPFVRWRGSTPATFAADGEGAPGEITVSVPKPADGRFTFRVDANRTAQVVLAASWHPRWTVTVDGERRPVEMVLPGTVAVTVRGGQHAVVFQYEAWGAMWVVALGGIALAATLLSAKEWRRRARVALIEAS